MVIRYRRSVHSLTDIMMNGVFYSNNGEKGDRMR